MLYCISTRFVFYVFHFVTQKSKSIHLCFVTRSFLFPFVILQGSIESLSVGEFKANLSQSLVELCATAFLQDPKVIFSICDLKIVTRPPSSSSKRPRKSKTRKSGSAGGGGGKGKLMLLANIGRFFSVSMTNIIVQVNCFMLYIIPFHSNLGELVSVKAS